MTEEMYRNFNDIIEDYICNYDIHLAANSEFFYNLYKNKKVFNLKLENLNYQKYSATEVFRKLEEFYRNFYYEDIKKIEDAFNNGTFNIKYRDESLELEDNYLSSHDDVVFYENGKTINIPLYGDTRDIMITAHEIRHYLNHPMEGRKAINDLLTEALSQFEEYLILEYFYNKEVINEEERKNFYKEAMIKFNDLSNYLLFILELIIIKQKLGTINYENYKFLFKENDYFEKNCVLFLKKHHDFTSFNWHLLGHFLDAYMIEQYETSDNFLEKFKKFNNELLENKGIECLKTIGLDFYNEEETINLLTNSMKYIENKFYKRKIK